MPLLNLARDINLRHLHALAAVADTGTFGRAAVALGFTQSAISQQIAALERLTNSALFERRGGARGVELTAAGRLMLRHARVLIAQCEQAESELGDLLAGTRDVVRVGTFQSITVTMLPLVIRRLGAELPSVHVRIVEDADPDDLVDPLVSGTVDVNFGVGAIDDPRVTTAVLGDDPYVVVAPLTLRHRARELPRHRRAHRPALIHSTPHLTLPIDVARTTSLLGQTEVYQRAIDVRLRRVGIEPDYAFRSADNGAVQAMVRVGLGVAVMPLLAVDVDDPDVLVCWPEPTLGAREVVIASRRDAQLSNAALRFIELADEVCRRTPAR